MPPVSVVRVDPVGPDRLVARAVELRSLDEPTVDPPGEGHLGLAVAGPSPRRATHVDATRCVDVVPPLALEAVGNLVAVMCSQIASEPCRNRRGSSSSDHSRPAVTVARTRSSGSAPSPSRSGSGSGSPLSSSRCSAVPVRAARIDASTCRVSLISRSMSLLPLLTSVIVVSLPQATGDSIAYAPVGRDAVGHSGSYAGRREMHRFGTVQESSAPGDLGGW